MALFLDSGGGNMVILVLLVLLCDDLFSCLLYIVLPAVVIGAVAVSRYGGFTDTPQL